jgi:hypothetical protein
MKRPPAIDRSGRVHAARQVPSPNFDARPPATPVDLLVVHNISLLIIVLVTITIAVCLTSCTSPTQPPQSLTLRVINLNQQQP